MVRFSPFPLLLFGCQCISCPVYFVAALFRSLFFFGQYIAFTDKKKKRIRNKDYRSLIKTNKCNHLREIAPFLNKVDWLVGNIFKYRLLLIDFFLFFF